MTMPQTDIIDFSSGNPVQAKKSRLNFSEALLKLNE